MTRAPRRSIAASFATGAVSGAMTVQGMPRLRAHQATPCAMLPADAVRTPRASCCGGRAAIALAAPRILKEPMGWRFSSLSQISAGSVRDVQAHERRAQRNTGQPLAGRANVTERRQYVWSVRRRHVEL